MSKKLYERPTKRSGWTKSLKRDVTYFHTKTRMEYKAIGFHAIRNPRFWDRMQGGGSITLRMADQIYAWLESKGYFFNPEGDCYVEERIGLGEEAQGRQEGSISSCENEGQEQNC